MGVGDIQPVALALALALMAGAYLLRFWRRRLLFSVSVRSEPPLMADLAVYSAAGLLSLGNLRVRSSYARALFGTPEGITSALPRFEAVTEAIVLSVLALAGGSALVVPQIAPLVLVACLGLLLAYGTRRSQQDKGASIDSSSGFVVPAAGILQRARYLLRPRPIFLSASLALAIAVAEIMALLALLSSSGEVLDASLAVAAVTSYALAALAGKASRLPGGFPVAGLCLAVVLWYASDVSPTTAVAIALSLCLSQAAVEVVAGFFGRRYVLRRLSSVSSARVHEHPGSPTH